MKHQKVNWTFNRNISVCLFIIFQSCELKQTNDVIIDTLVNKQSFQKKNILNTPLIFKDSIYIHHESINIFCKNYNFQINSKIKVDSNINNSYYFMNGNKNIIDQELILMRDQDSFKISINDFDFNKKSTLQLPVMVIYSIEFNREENKPIKLYFSSLSNINSDVIYISTDGVIDAQINKEYIDSINKTWTDEFDILNWGGR